MPVFQYIAYLTLSYAFVSAFFFVFPNLLHKKKQLLPVYANAINNNQILRVAHRGGPRLTTQNTIQAFQKVLPVSDMLEMDVCQTKDNILVVHHDQKLERTCGVDLEVRQYNYVDLPKFKKNIRLDFATNMYVQSNDQKIPTLQQVFQQFQDIPMNIQLKTPTERAMEEFTKLVRKYNRQDRTVCGIRNENQKRFCKTNPDFFLFLNDTEILKMLLAYYTGFLPFINIQYNSLQFPIYTEDFHKKKLNQLQGSVPEWKINFMFSIMKFINNTMNPLIWHLQKRGIPTLAWVCNNQQQYHRAAQLKVIGIMTDDPFALNQYLQKKTAN